MRVAVIQMDVMQGDLNANMAAVEDHVQALARSASPPDVITLPELWSTGYALGEAKALASPGGMREMQFLAGLAKKYRVAFAGGSVLALDKKSVFNRALVINNKGELVASYDKIHLFRPMDEHRWLAFGSQRVLFDFFGMRCACVICYDIRFPELIRRLALDGAEALFVCAEWPAPRIDQWEALLRARAVENQMIVVACNRCGTSADTHFGGRSLIIAPDGKILARCGDGQERCCAEVDECFPSALRASFPVFIDRRPEAY